jgi:hypothetical protein
MEPLLANIRAATGIVNGMLVPNVAGHRRALTRALTVERGFDREDQERPGPPPTLAWDIAAGSPREPINGQAGVL